MGTVEISRTGRKMRWMKRIPAKFMTAPRENAADRRRRILVVLDGKASRPGDGLAKTFSEIKTIQNRSGGEQVNIHVQFGWDLPMNLHSRRYRICGAKYPVEKMRLFKENLRPLT
jgi:hypothetical protein